MSGEAMLGPTRRASRLATLIERNGTLIVLLCGSACFALLRLPTGLATDSWMDLLSGREIVQHGLPVYDTLTVWAHGRRWVDQQWLAQVALYGIDRLGGIRLVMLVHAALATGALVAATTYARLRASALSVTWIGALALFGYFAAGFVVRSQSFAYVLFVGLLALLLEDERRHSRRVYLAFPLLVLWTNLHGSELLGAALVSTYGVIGLARRVSIERRHPMGWLSLVVGPWAASLASPYATSLPSYYRHILIESDFGHYVTEWAPTTLSLVTAPLFLLVVGGAWLVGRARGQMTPFEVIAFLGTALMAFRAERNMVWFSLVAVVVLPKLLDEIRTPTDEPRHANRLLAGTALVATVLVTAVVATRSDGWFSRDYPPGPASVAATAAGQTGRVFANEHYPDWLIWTHPELAGRIAFDSRLELLSKDQLASVALFRERAGNWRATAAGYQVLVLSGTHDRNDMKSLVDDGEARVIANEDGIVVLKRTRSSRPSSG